VKNGELIADEVDDGLELSFPPSLRMLLITVSSAALAR
jgi:hypothetical protein